MQQRTLGKTGFEVGEIGLGTWQAGGKWGSSFNHQLADTILNAAVDRGVNFIDTADVYNDGDSERAVGRLVRKRSERIYVATKCGRGLQPHVDEQYTPLAMRDFVERSLQRMDLERIDLIQLHCPPPETYDRPEIFGVFDDLKKEGKILHLGVSVGTVEQGLKAIQYDNVAAIQIIFNMLRQRPSETFFTAAAERNVGIITRVPLASGLLTGKLTADSEFEEGDHRSFTGDDVLDYGETFSGLPFEKGLAVVDKLQQIFPPQQPLAPIALRWILMFEEVSCVIPGASKPEQVLSNVEAGHLPALSKEEMKAIRQIYEQEVWPEIADKGW